MLAFEVRINGKRHYVAGHAEAQGLTVFLSGDCYVRDAHLMASVAVPHDKPGGLATLSYETAMVTIGDEITIRVVDVETPDVPVDQNVDQGGYGVDVSASK